MSECFRLILLGLLNCSDGCPVLCAGIYISFCSLGLSFLVRWEEGHRAGVHEFMLGEGTANEMLNPRFVMMLRRIF